MLNHVQRATHMKHGEHGSSSARLGKGIMVQCISTENIAVASRGGGLYGKLIPVTPRALHISNF